MQEALHDKLGALNLAKIEKEFPAAFELLLEKGYEELEDPEYFQKISPYLSLSSALENKEIDYGLFFEELQRREQESLDPEKTKVSDFPEFTALLPCGLRNPFTELFQSFASQSLKKFEALIEGNVNHELSYYDYVQEVGTPEKLPDLMITSDVNSLFHKRFQDTFVDVGTFLPSKKVTNPLFLESGMADPMERYSFIATNLLVIVVNKAKLGDRPVPKKWVDILEPHYQKSIAIRGEEDFYCHSVTIPYYLLYGESALRKLERNIHSMHHPSKMVKMAPFAGDQDPAVYIMPYFFARKITKKDAVEIIFPEEGAFTSPVSFFIKRERAQGLETLKDFLQGPEVARLCEQLAFPSPYTSESPTIPETAKLYWVGWDTLRGEDLGDIKKKIDTIIDSEKERLGS